MPFDRSARDASTRTVQDYLDETPLWPDGTKVADTPLTGMQLRIWLLACAGKFFEGMVVFMTGVALPLIVREFSLTAAQKGLVSSAALAGILVGAVALGSLSDTYGRKRMFLAEMVIFTLCLGLLVASPNLAWLTACLFGTGLALGCDYPTAHMIITESIPTAKRGRLVLSAFGFQAVGALCGTAVGYLVLRLVPDLAAWRWMYATVLAPAVVVLAARFFVTDSGQWLVSRGRIKQAERELSRLLRRDPPYPAAIRLAPAPKAQTSGGVGLKALFAKPLRRATILAAVPWFLQDLGTYGIGIFTPVVLASTLGEAPKYAGNVAALVHADMLAAKGAAVIDVLLIAGIVAAVLLADRVGRIRLQVLGFIGCAAGLALAALSLWAEGAWRTGLLFAGFMLFNFMTNLGPNAMTYLISGEVFPTRIRGQGAGLAAAAAKIGAVLTAFLFPVLLAGIGTSVLLACLVGTSLLGAAVTWRFRIETAGLNLEELDRTP